MKTYTKKEAAQAMLDGKVLTDGELRFLWDFDWFIAHDPITGVQRQLGSMPDNLYDYEPPKPENKVIVIEESTSGEVYNIKGLAEFPYVTENDAIRTAMEWIGEKVTKLVLKRPAWANGDMEAERDLDNAFFCHTRLAIREALLMRWPIEVIEEV